MADPINSKISALQVRDHTTVNDASEFVVAYGSKNYKISLASMLKKILGVVNGAVRKIGANENGAIVVVGAGQSLQDQHLDSPRINSSIGLQATSQQIDNACLGATSNVQNQIDVINGELIEIRGDVGTLQERGTAKTRYTYSVIKTASGTKQNISAESIFIGLDAYIENKTGINPFSVICSYYKSEDGGIKYLGENNANIEIVPEEQDGVIKLDYIQFPVSSDEKYLFVINFELV